MPVWLIIAFVVFSAFVLYGFGALTKKQKKQSAKATIVSYVFFTLIFLAIWIFAFSVPPYVILLSIVAVFIHCFCGYYMDLYNRSQVFDRYLHAFGSFAFSLLIYCLIQNLFETGGSRAFQSLFVFSVGMTLGVVFELLEAAIDAKSNAGAQRGLQDTNADMLGNLIGCLLAGIFAFFFFFS